ERSQEPAEIPGTEQVRAPDGWTKTFTDPRLCAAIVDRLTFGGTIIETGTESYRLARTKAQHNSKP
ncbi:ATP-binding protein, partial [Streptosporangium lutulentum]